MDLAYVVHMANSNASGSGSGDAVETDAVYRAPIDEDLAGTVPYLVIIGLALLSGSVGNVLVIASVVIDKVIAPNMSFLF